jgi:branched-chain amino acid aminotransferase
MTLVEYNHGKWGDLKIVPYGELRLTPAMLALHYGQAIFEGMKAFIMQDGAINIFRPHKHHQRILKSLERMCMPAISQEMFIQSLQALVEVDKKWIPRSEGASLYLRPVVFASESRLGVKVSDQYIYAVLTSPVAAYQSKPYHLKIEDHYVRTAEGGTGFAKCAGNYGGAYYPTQMARQQGFDQILWTDHKEHKYIDEVGMMNVMFIIDGELVTPQLSSAILDGVTRDSIITLARDMGVKTVERRISVDELKDGLASGRITEMFGAGTAAVVAPVAVVNIQGKSYSIPEAGEDSFQLRVKKKLHDIRMGLLPDVHGWNYVTK